MCVCVCEREREREREREGERGHPFDICRLKSFCQNFPISRRPVFCSCYIFELIYSFEIWGDLVRAATILHSSKQAGQGACPCTVV